MSRVGPRTERRVAGQHYGPGELILSSAPVRQLLRQILWTPLNTSPNRALSDSLSELGWEIARCETILGFSTSTGVLKSFPPRATIWSGLRGSSKDVFDESADLRLLAIGPGDGLWHRLGLGLFAMDFLN